MDIQDEDKLWNQAHSVLNSGDEDDAITLFTELANTEDWRGSYMVGWILEEKGRRAHRNYIEATRRYSRGLSQEENYLPYRTNYITAAHWYSRALSQEENYLPHLGLARYYYYGLSGKYDYKLAFEHLQMFGPQRDPVAQIMMAELLYLGLGVPKDMSAARKLFNSAAKAGYPAALLGLICLAKAERNYSQAILYFFRTSSMAIKLIMKQKDHPRLVGMGGKRGTLRRNWVKKSIGNKHDV